MPLPPSKPKSAVGDVAGSRAARAARRLAEQHKQAWWDRERRFVVDGAFVDGDLDAAGDVERAGLLRSADTAAYAARFGLGGVDLFVSDRGARIARLPMETLPGHVNYAWFVDLGGGGGEHGGRFLFDCGSGLGRSRSDLEAGVACLKAAWGIDVVGAAEKGGVDAVVISHAHIDHFGDVAFWKQRLRAPVWVHELDARVLEHFVERQVLGSQELAGWLLRAGVDADEREALRTLQVSKKESFVPVDVDRRLRHRQQLFSDRVRVIHTPGHCPGHICLRVDDVLLVADQVLSPVSPHISPQALHPGNGLERYLFGLSRLLDEKGVNRVLSAHYDDVTDLAARVVGIVEEHREKLGQALAACASAENGARVVDVAAAMFGKREGYHVLLALLEAGTHVEYLHQQGALRVQNLDDVARDPRCAPRYVAGGNVDATHGALEMALGR